MSKGIKIAISGKGGVGKTTLSAALAKLYSEAGYKVIAVDADPDANLATALGVPESEAAAITPISAMKDMIAERTDSQPGTIGGFFSLNPKVDDIPETFYTDAGGVKLMVLGTIDSPGAGCICPESSLLRRLVQHLIIERDEAVILDMEAGIEHLGRATAQAVDVLIVLIEPGRRSLQTAHRIAELGGALGIPHIGLVLNKMADESQLAALKDDLPDLVFLGTIGRHQDMIDIDLAGEAAWSSANLMGEVKEIYEAVQGLHTEVSLG
jgi:CO dehydrogenase maturation factor